MPANLTPEYRDAERAFKEASTTADKTAALEHMLAVIPKHKGTEKMQGELRRRLAKLKQESEHARRAGPTRGAPAYQVEKEGAGQAVLAGAPNTGKSALVRRLTHAAPEVADYPFTTRMALPGMMPFEDIQIQLVDLPPLDAQYGEAWVPQAIRNADAVLVVVDLAAADLLDEIENTIALLDKAKIALGLRTSLPYGYVAKPALVVANKVDLSGARENFEAFTELYAGRFPAVSVSAETGEGLEEFKRAVFRMLGILRVYTKEPGKKADLTRPYVLRARATVAELAGRVHKDILAHLKYARVWGHGKFEGQMVHRDHALADRDIVELHT
jgi:small GTP-binding protein